MTGQTETVHAECTETETVHDECTAAALERAVRHLRGLQDEAGWWKGELETNVTMDAEDLLLRQFLGIRTEEETEEAAVWVRANQRADGTWANFHGGPGDLSTTIEAYLALRLAGDPVDAPHMRAAAAFVVGRGGIESSRVFTRIWLALFGLWPWEDLPVLPPEIMLLPPWVPLNIYDFGCWARQTVVPLAVVGAYRPVRPIPVDLPELRSGAHPVPSRSMRSRAGWFQRLDDVLQRYHRRPLASARELALGRAEAWIIERQEADGSWGGIQPPWVYSLMALAVRGYALDHPVMKAGIAGLDGFIVRDASGRRLEACQSPVWDTALAVSALADAGAGADDPALRRAAAWLIDEEVTVPGDWRVRRPHLAPGGWAFEFENDHYPDVDDTAEVALALARVDLDDRGAVDRGLTWLEGMQSKDDGWAAFDADNTRALCRSLPFCDFGELIDPPSADVTAHAVECLATLGRAPDRVRSGVAWLRRAQEPDGSWFGRWGSNHLYGTGAVVPALVAAGVAGDDPAVRRAVAFLTACQNDDGGWGEDLRSYDDPAWRGRGESTASQTAWALLALVAAGERGPVLDAGVRWLVEHQRSDGTWDEPWFTGTGFPGDFYINYHLYRLIFPVMALGRVRNGTPAPAPAPAPAAAVDPAFDGGPLVVVTPMRIEARAVGGQVLRSGMGPERARRARSRLPGHAPAALVGVAGGVEPTLGAGDLVVASEVWDADLPGAPRIPLPAAHLVAGELRRSGHRVHVGPVASTRRFAGRARRAALHAQGALAVDTESAWLVDPASPCPTVVVRAIADGGSSNVISGGVVALRALRGVRPALEAWARATGPRQVTLAAPRSFCAGVERAIEIVERAIDRFGPPVYVRRQIVHNAHVVRALAARGAVFVDELDQVPAGAVVVLAAHGVAPAVRAEAEARGDLEVIDATCPLVAKVHKEARRYAASGRHILLIGHAEHEEVVGTVGEAPDRTSLVESVDDVSHLSIPDHEPVAYLTQTTLSVDETAGIVDALRGRFPDIAGPATDDICYATQNRQDAVRSLAPHCDLVIVVGSANSSNTARLVEAARASGCRAELVEDVSELQATWLVGARRVGVTAGASAPEALVAGVVQALGHMGPIDVREHRTTEESVHFVLPRQVR